MKTIKKRNKYGRTIKDDYMPNSVNIYWLNTRIFQNKQQKTQKQNYLEIIY